MEASGQQPDRGLRRNAVGLPGLVAQSLGVTAPEISAVVIAAVVATKIDAAGEGTRLKSLQAFCKRRRIRCLPISAATREGLTELITFVGQQVEQLRATACETKS